MGHKFRDDPRKMRLLLLPSLFSAVFPPDSFVFLSLLLYCATEENPGKWKLYRPSSWHFKNLFLLPRLAMVLEVLVG